MINLKQLLMEGAIEQAAEDFIKQTVKGTEWEGKVYAVGGYVRDLVRGVDAKDLDIGKLFYFVTFGRHQS